MGALTQVYVDPSINANTGSGTIGSPYGDLQYAFNTKTRDSTNGDQFNIKVGTPEVLTAALSLSTYGTPTNNAPCVISGYTSTANDGGQAEITGNNGNFNIFAGGRSYMTWKHLKLHDTGTASVMIAGATGTQFIECEIHDTDLDAIGNNTSSVLVTGCNIYDFGRHGIQASRLIATLNWVVNGNTTGRAIDIQHPNADSIGTISDNFIIVTANGNAINVGSEGQTLIRGNAILCTDPTNTKRGIFDQGGGTILDNLIEGFSGTGGAAIENNGAAGEIWLLGYNSYYNCTATPLDLGDVRVNLGHNEDLVASPFAKSGSLTFANRWAYFAPVNVGSVLGGRYLAG